MRETLNEAATGVVLSVLVLALAAGLCNLIRFLLT